MRFTEAVIHPSRSILEDRMTATLTSRTSRLRSDAIHLNRRRNFDRDQFMRFRHCYDSMHENRTLSHAKKGDFEMR